MRRSLLLTLAGLTLAAGSVCAQQQVTPPGGGGAPTPPVVSGPNTVSSQVSVPSGAASYQWRRNGSNISAATAATYTIQGADAGTNLSVLITTPNFAVAGAAIANSFFFPTGGELALAAAAFN